MAWPLRSPEIAIGLGRVRQLGKQGECLFRPGSLGCGMVNHLAYSFNKGDNKTTVKVL
jgi:hypothetical protein